LRREREEMIARQQHESTTDTAHVRAVQRENVQLNLKVKSLLAELDELRGQREHAGMQADNVTRLQVKQLAELSASIKALEVRATVKLAIEALPSVSTTASNPGLYFRPGAAFSKVPRKILGKLLILLLLLLLLLLLHSFQLLC